MRIVNYEEYHDNNLNYISNSFCNEKEGVYKLVIGNNTINDKYVELIDFFYYDKNLPDDTIILNSNSIKYLKSNNILIINEQFIIVGNNYYIIYPNILSIKLFEIDPISFITTDINNTRYCVVGKFILNDNNTKLIFEDTINNISYYVNNIVNELNNRYLENPIEYYNLVLSKSRYYLVKCLPCIDMQNFLFKNFINRPSLINENIKYLEINVRNCGINQYYISNNTYELLKERCKIPTFNNRNIISNLAFLGNNMSKEQSIYSYLQNNNIITKQSILIRTDKPDSYFNKISYLLIPEKYINIANVVTISSSINIDNDNNSSSSSSIVSYGNTSFHENCVIFNNPLLILTDTENRTYFYWNRKFRLLDKIKNLSIIFNLEEMDCTKNVYDISNINISDIKLNNLVDKYNVYEKFEKMIEQFEELINNNSHCSSIIDPDIVNIIIEILINKYHNEIVPELELINIDNGIHLMKRSKLIDEMINRIYNSK